MKPEPTDFVILSGFLGSGKTTLLSEFLAQGADESTAVIVNDVGEVNIDGAILAVHDGVPMATLGNGCVCCSLINDLQFTVESLIASRQETTDVPFSRIVLECSGLSDPGGVMRALSALSSLDMRVRVVTTYAANNEINRDDFPLLAAQVCGAHTVIVTKLDLCHEAQRLHALDEIRLLAPLSRCIVERDRTRRATAAFSAGTQATPLVFDSAMTRIGLPGGHARVRAFTLSWEARLDWHAFSDWMENVAGFLDRRLLRVKGILHVQNCADGVLIQAVGQHFDLPKRIVAPSSRSQIVVIALDTDAKALLAIPTRLPPPQVSTFSSSTSSGDVGFRFTRPLMLFPSS
ncbi:putative GTP-binding protein YjiA [Pandoraea anapnoica]|uniref:Putative GTP-binding protein YjiA n=1 Tax=Pandoraea anapnoica TaxID=2508301 RepID=A0A5E5AJS3_9BURK|nr:GTP-binding protein [Pandoraea anapnoica]VVE72320.1 putative GTP-binding protein YjiA [Pandoraea anapnoica]